MPEDGHGGNPDPGTAPSSREGDGRGPPTAQHFGVGRCGSATNPGPDVWERLPDLLATMVHDP